MKTKHTKGPWAWQLFGDTYSLTAQHGNREIIIGAIEHPKMGYPVVGMNDDGIMEVVDKLHPNAKLVAAAPELLSELDKQSNNIYLLKRLIKMNKVDEDVIYNALDDMSKDIEKVILSLNK